MLRTWFIGAAFALAACGGSSPATHFRANLSAANEVGSVTSDGGGTADYTLDGGTVSYTVTFSGLTSNANAAHIHVGPAGVNGGVTVPFSQVPHATSGTFSGTFTAANVMAAQTSDGGIGVDAGDFDGLLTLMRAGNTYTNVHTTQNPSGEIRGQNQPQ
jgi:CHRD domain